MLDTIFNTLLNYGVLGIWTFTLILERTKTHKELKEVINNNTHMLGEIKETIHSFKYK